MSDGALDQMHIDIYTPEGQTEVDVLIAGGINGSLRYNLRYNLMCSSCNAWSYGVSYACSKILM